MLVELRGEIAIIQMVSANSYSVCVRKSNGQGNKVTVNTEELERLFRTLDKCDKVYSISKEELDKAGELNVSKKDIKKSRMMKRTPRWGKRR